MKIFLICINHILSAQKLNKLMATILVMQIRWSPSQQKVLLDNTGHCDCLQEHLSRTWVFLSRLENDKSPDL